MLPFAPSRPTHVLPSAAGGSFAEALGACSLASHSSTDGPVPAAAQRQRRGAGSSNSSCSAGLPARPAATAVRPPLPWPAGPRALHCSAACARSAALPQQQQQQQQQAAAGGGPPASAGAEAAVTLSGMAVKLAGGDPFLLQVEPGVEGPLAAYTQGRLRGMYRKVGRVGGVAQLVGASCAAASGAAAAPSLCWRSRALQARAAGLGAAGPLLLPA